MTSTSLPVAALLTASLVSWAAFVESTFTTKKLINLPISSSCGSDNSFAANYQDVYLARQANRTIILVNLTSGDNLTSPFVASGEVDIAWVTSASTDLKRKDSPEVSSASIVIHEWYGAYGAMVGYGINGNTAWNATALYYNWDVPDLRTREYRKVGDSIYYTTSYDCLRRFDILSGKTTSVTSVPVPPYDFQSTCSLVEGDLIPDSDFVIVSHTSSSSEEDRMMYLAAWDFVQNKAIFNISFNASHAEGYATYVGHQTEEDELGNGGNDKARYVFVSTADGIDDNYDLLVYDTKVSNSSAVYRAFNFTNVQVGSPRISQGSSAKRELTFILSEQLMVYYKLDLDNAGSIIKTFSLGSQLSGGSGRLLQLNADSTTSSPRSSSSSSNLLFVFFNPTELKISIYDYLLGNRIALNSMPFYYIAPPVISVKSLPCTTRLSPRSPSSLSTFVANYGANAGFTVFDTAGNSLLSAVNWGAGSQPTSCGSRNAVLDPLNEWLAYTSGSLISVFTCDSRTQN